MSAAQLTFELDGCVIAAPIGSTALLGEIDRDWSYCASYCRAEIRQYELTLFVGQDREWTDPEPHDICDDCARKTVARGNRLRLLSPNARVEE